MGFWLDFEVVGQFGCTGYSGFPLRSLWSVRRARKRVRNPDSTSDNTERPSRGMKVSEVSSLGNASALRAMNTTIVTIAATNQLRVFTSWPM